MTYSRGNGLISLVLKHNSSPIAVFNVQCLSNEDARKSKRKAKRLFLKAKVVASDVQHQIDFSIIFFAGRKSK